MGGATEEISRMDGIMDSVRCCGLMEKDILESFMQENEKVREL